MVKLTIAATTLLSLLAGCSSAHLFRGGRPVQARIANPVASGELAQAQLVWEDADTERERGLPPGTLRDEVTLVRFDQEAVCFAVLLRELDARVADVRNFNVYFRADDTLESDSPAINMMAPHTEVLSGMNPHEVQVGTETYCSNQDSTTRQCLQWSERPVSETSWVPGPVPVTTAAANLCFAHGGAVDAATAAVALRLDVKREVSGGGGGGLWGIPGTGSPRNRRTFQWDLQGAGDPATATVAAR